MSKYIPGNQKHLTLEDRIYIENELANIKSYLYPCIWLLDDLCQISRKQICWYDWKFTSV